MCVCVCVCVYVCVCACACVRVYMYVYYDQFLFLPSHTYQRFLTKNNGVLYENDLLQIGVKSEFKKNLGKRACSASGL